jgi:hypothetical protein
VTIQIGRLAILFIDLLRAHRLDDLGELVSKEFVLLNLILVEVDGPVAEVVGIGLA